MRSHTNRVDDQMDDGYNPPFRVPIRSVIGIAPLMALLLLGCSTRSESGRGPIDLGAELLALEVRAPERPLWITFEWDAREREARYSGQGAARVEPPRSARLDLFGPRGEGYLSAAVVDDEVRLPPNAELGLVPPPTLLWGALGVFKRPVGAELVRAERKGERIYLEYQDAEGRWYYEFDSERLKGVEWRGAGNRRKTIELKGEGPTRLPEEATYRDWATFTELKIRVDQVEEVDSFPPDIWHPDVE